MASTCRPSVAATRSGEIPRQLRRENHIVLQLLVQFFWIEILIVRLILKHLRVQWYGIAYASQPREGGKPSTVRTRLDRPEYDQLAMCHNMQKACGVGDKTFGLVIEEICPKWYKWRSLHETDRKFRETRIFYIKLFVIQVRTQPS
jgi:hypothetical protein